MNPNKFLEPSEQNFLLFLESCAVETLGKVRTTNLSQLEMRIAEQWADAKFIRFGKIGMNDQANGFTHWVELSDDAWSCVYKIRRLRAQQGIDSCTFEKCDVKFEVDGE